MKWRIVLLFLFLISEPVGMCHSAVELNGSCCSCKTNKSPSTQATSVATFLVLSIEGLWQGHRTVGGTPSPASPGPSLLTLWFSSHHTGRLHRQGTLPWEALTHQPNLRRVRVFEAKLQWDKPSLFFLFFNFDLVILRVSSSSNS